jgi:ketosteroid isomerase-like protein
MNLCPRHWAIAAVLLTGIFMVSWLGCGGTKGALADPEPFKKAIAQYLERNNMAMALKEIKEGPTVQGNTATLTASLTHAALGGPAVTWQIRFEKNADGSWKAVSHK